MKRKLTETYNQLANDYEHNVDTKNLYNIEYERPAMMSLLPSDLRGVSVFDAVVQQVGIHYNWLNEEHGSLQLI